MSTTITRSDLNERNEYAASRDLNVLGELRIRKSADTSKQEASR